MFYRKLLDRISELEDGIESLKDSYVTCSVCGVFISKYQAGKVSVVSGWDGMSRDVYYCHFHKPEWDKEDSKGNKYKFIKEEYKLIK